MTLILQNLFARFAGQLWPSLTTTSDLKPCLPMLLLSEWFAHMGLCIEEQQSADLLQKAPVVRSPVAWGLGSVAKVIAARIKQHHLRQPSRASRCWDLPPGLQQARDDLSGTGEGRLIVLLRLMSMQPGVCCRLGAEVRASSGTE